MRKSLALTLFMGVSLGTIAQNFKNPDVPVRYIGIPKIVQDGMVNTYNIEIKGYEEELNNLGYPAGAIADKLNLRAFTRVNGQGENTVIFRFSGYGDLRGNLSSQTGTDGKSRYCYTYTYNLPMSYEIHAGGRRISGGEIRMQQNLGASPVETYTYSTSYFSTSTEAYNNYESKLTELKNQIRKNFDAKFAVFVQTIKNEIDYPEIKGYTNFGMFKSTKKEDYTDFERAVGSAERALAPLVAGQPRTGLRERMDSAMTFWRTKMKTLDPTNKDQDKLFFACANNLANSYYWLDNIDSAMYFIEEAKKAKFREGYLSMLENDIKVRKAQLATLKANGIDPYTGPAPASSNEIKAIEAEAEQKKLNRDAEIAARVAAEKKKYEPVIDRYDGYIIDRADKKVSASIICYGANNGAKTGKKYFAPAGSDKETELSAAYVKACEFGSSRYEVVRYIDATGIGKETNLLQVMYESDKIKVYKLATMVDNRPSTSIFYKRPNEEVATNTSNLAFTVTYKKQLAKYFENCPAVATKALAGEYTDSDDMRIAAAVDYSNKCQ